MKVKQTAEAVDEKYKLLQTKKTEAEEKQRAASDAFKLAAQAANAQSKKVSNVASVAASEPRSFTKALYEFNSNSTKQLTKHNSRASTNLSNETLQRRRNGIAASKAARNARSGAPTSSTIASGVVGNAFNASGSASPAVASPAASSARRYMQNGVGHASVSLVNEEDSPAAGTAGGRRRKHRTHKKRHVRKTHHKLRK